LHERHLNLRLVKEDVIGFFFGIPRLSLNIIKKIHNKPRHIFLISSHNHTLFL